MAPRRWLLLFLSLASLLVLAYAGVLYAFSTPVTGSMEGSARLPGEESPREGLRALVLPLLAVEEVPTLAAGGEGWDGTPGALILVAPERPEFPSGTREGRILRALAFVRPDANGTHVPATLELKDVPARVGESAGRVNLTLDVPALAGSATGFLAKADAEDEVVFVPSERVVGQVARFEDGADVYLLLGMGALGFVMPLVALIFTHRPSGRPGIGDAVCAECRGPMPGNAEFCTRCGAWKKGREPADA